MVSYVIHMHFIENDTSHNNPLDAGRKLKRA